MKKKLKKKKKKKKNYMVTTNQKTSICIQKSERKGHKCNTKENHQTTSEETKRGKEQK